MERFSPPKSSKIAAVSILKPVRGVDHEAYENFASMCQLDYPEYEIIFGVGEADDPVIPLLQKLQAEFPETLIRVIVGIIQLGSCHKTNTLCRLALEAKHSLLVINDSDVRVEKDYLRQILASFSDPKVGLVTALFRSRAGDGFAEAGCYWGADRLSGQHASTAEILANRFRLWLDDGPHQGAARRDRWVRSHGQLSLGRLCARP
jgi:cellulose synthase/poly-beta-1,6-N-acetylglucosamine synthase-like glycosyltransferase